jgi:hypothetical protein
MASALLDHIAELMDRYNEQVTNGNGDEFVWMEHISRKEYERRIAEQEEDVVDTTDAAETSLGCDYDDEEA